MKIPLRVAQRAAAQHEPTADGCLISTYAVGSHGYAVVGWHEDGRNPTTTAHRAAWVGATGQQIPEGLTVDHLCHVRRCVNPDHLRLLTNEENGSDNGKARLNPSAGRLLSCGHEGVLAGNGRSVYCRECQAAKGREKRAAARRAVA